MKKATVIIGFLLLFALPLLAERVDPETARKVASTFLNNNGAKADQLTDLSKVAGFSNLYIFNGEEGFVVMSADDCVKPILGYSLTGKFVAKDMPSNLSGWLQEYNDHIQYAIDNRTRATAETAQLWKALAEGDPKTSKVTSIVNNLLSLSTTWGQSPLYNDLCPYSDYYQQQTVTGCVATAMAQIMKYWEYPSHGVGEHTYTHIAYTDDNNHYHDAMGELSVDFGATTYDWDNMPTKLTATSSAAQINAVATLMYHCGVSVEMNYGVSSIGGSGATTADVATALRRYFGYSQCEFKYRADNEDNWVSMLKAELDNNRPLEYSGRNSGGGHAFVCCGYDSEDNFYFNWGWNGNSDGFYSLDNNDTGNPVILYSEKQGAIFGIQPSNCTASEPEITHTLTNLRDLTLNWDPVDGATSYLIYRNGFCIGSSNVNSYTETAPFGTNVYYVRSIDSNNEMSLSSNLVTITVDYQNPIVEDLSASLSGNNVSLSWSEPSWRFPETPSVTLTYGDGTFVSDMGYMGEEHMYWGHRYPASDIRNYTGMVIYKISFYAPYDGDYQYFIYQGTNNNLPQTLIANGSISLLKTGWIDIDLYENIKIDGNQDLWVFIFDPEYKFYPAAYCNFTDHTKGSYFASADPTIAIGTLNGLSWLIRTYLTDGAYTYNLYDNIAKLNGDSPITSTNFIVENIGNNTAHQYTVKTITNDSESDASNMIGFTLGSASLETLSLDADDAMTLTANSSLSVTGTLTNTDPSRLIIGDGAQLINNCTEVKATVKKTIAGFQTNDNKGNWYLIASPITDQLNIANATNLNAANTDDYDLYIFDQSNDAEWLNYKQDHFTTIDNKTGYLYAHRSDIDIAFAGTLNNTDGSVPISYTSNKPFAEYNLVGNPFPCDATINKADFYRIVETEEGSKIQLATTSTIAPMEGIFVKADDGNDKTVTFSKSTAKENGASGSMIDISVSRNPGSVLDNVRIRFDADQNMEKLILHNGGTQLFIPQSGINYALVVNHDFADVPLNFKAVNNGTYTLSFDIKNLDLDYLYLVDNLTGANIDLLTTPSYSYEAKTDDYSARFRLLFKGIGESTNILDNIEGDILIMDVTGRVVGSDRNAKLTPGVYVIRIINGNDIKTEKIIIK